jgi:hypothetical protein
MGGEMSAYVDAYAALKYVDDKRQEREAAEAAKRKDETRLNKGKG